MVWFEALYAFPLADLEIIVAGLFLIELAVAEVAAEVAD